MANERPEDKFITASWTKDYGQNPYGKSDTELLIRIINARNKLINFMYGIPEIK